MVLFVDNAEGGGKVQIDDRWARGLALVLVVVVLVFGAACGGTGSDGGGIGGSSQACYSGDCENLWMSDGHVICCSSDFPFARRENDNCYQTFEDAYVGTPYAVTVPAFRECY